jgi:nitrite reductase/ring-hydroxylating ferredoxin subunit
VCAARLTDCPPGSAIEVAVGSRIMALFNVEGTIYALDGICPHQGGPLGKGDVAGCRVTCPWHGWQFDVRSGRHLANPAVKQPCFATRIAGDTIEVDVDEPF